MECSGQYLDLRVMKLGGQFRILHIEELCDLYRSSTIVRLVKSRRLWWAGHVARMGETNSYRILMGKCLKMAAWRSK